MFQETLRIHSAVSDLIREASEDNMLPLSKPVIGRSGKVYHEIFIPKGSWIHASLSGYNTYAQRFFWVNRTLRLLFCRVGTLMSGAVTPGFLGLIVGSNRV